MTTGLDCRMTSLFLNTTRRRGEQSNTQNTVAYIVRQGGLQRSNNLSIPPLWTVATADRSKVTVIYSLS